MPCFIKIFLRSSILIFLFLIILSIKVEATSVLTNGDFSTNLNSWQTYTNGTVSFGVENAQSVTRITNVGTNSQLYQTGFALKPNTDYKLSFKAKSSRGGSAFNVFIHQHASPNTNYGLSKSVSLTNTLDNYEFNFKTSGFNTTTTDTRLRFWFVNSSIRSGDVISIDDIILQEINLAPQNSVNVLKNGDFATNVFSPWVTYSVSGGVVYSVVGSTAVIKVNSRDSNSQMYQAGITLKPNTRYTLKFEAKSNRPQTPINVSVLKHITPFTSYGFRSSYNLSTQSNSYQETFVTSGFNSNVNDARLMFQFSDSLLQSGDTITIDNIKLEEGDTKTSTNPTPNVPTPLSFTPTPTPAVLIPTPTPVDPVGDGGSNKYDLTGDNLVNMSDLLDLIRYIFGQQ